MARIPEHEIEQLKREVSLVRLIEADGIALAKQGKDYAGLCPFHEEATPSLIVTPTKNLYHCFGCNAAGGPIDWVMQRRGVSFRHAVELLREGLPLAAGVEAAPVTRSTVRTLAAPLATDTEDAEALQRVVGFYHQTLKGSEDALAYLTARGLNHPELIDHFQLGYANRTLAYRLPEKNRSAGAAMRSQLQRLGILRESGHEHFNGSLIVPVFDAAGRVVELYGRKLLDNLRAGTPKHLYLPGPHAGVWNAAALTASREIILCEALIDAMTFWCAGYRHVTAAYGVHGFTDEMLAAFQQHQIERVLIAYDRDDAGNQAAETLAEKLMAVGIDCYRVLFPKGMDANAYALRVQPAGRSLGLALRQAEWMGKGRAPSRPRVLDAVIDLPSAVIADGSSLAVPTVEAKPAMEPVLPASPLPDAPSSSTPAYQVVGEEMRLLLSDRFYRVRGLPTKPLPEQLKVNLLVKDPATEGYYVDTVDLYSARQRQVFGKQASLEVGASEEAIKKDLGQLILALEGWQEQQLVQARQAQAQATLSDADRGAALELLQTPDLMTRVLTDFARCGVVGEAVNKQVAYLAAVSRKLDRPLAVMVQSSSAAGKSSLMDAVLRFVPPEERVQYSAMTGQSLFYLGDKDLRHKILAISEEEGASQASYALKLLQSEGEVSIASTGKNAQTGQLETQEYRVEGPVMLFSTTTAIDLDEELLNRCLVLSVDESREQTQAIHAQQRLRRTLDGLRASEDKARLTALHQNAQRLLRPLKVVNPYAERLTFLSDKTRMRRDHDKYLALIDAIALLHQCQREVKREQYHGAVIEYVEVSVADIALANRLAHAVLGSTLDELPPQTRRLLGLLTAWVRSEAAQQGCAPSALRFTRKQVREVTGWGQTQLKVHLGRLEDMEYLAVHRQPFGKGIAYELRFDGEVTSEGPHLMGLIDAATLHAYDDEKSGRVDASSGSDRPMVGTASAVDRSPETLVQANDSDVLAASVQQARETARRSKHSPASHRNDGTLSLAAVSA
ncbi:MULTISPECIES: CHC2 zinc finger domain-containing protein [unclassified Dyella]|uniref:CHC2 zinc finger domain-containing protein n=1 Tax=unclassified Dyella TaxID=2634549 RepID=UPI003F8DAA95